MSLKTNIVVTRNPAPNMSIQIMTIEMSLGQVAGLEMKNTDTVKTKAKNTIEILKDTGKKLKFN